MTWNSEIDSFEFYSSFMTGRFYLWLIDCDYGLAGEVP
jgi:hypothetical protein